MDIKIYCTNDKVERDRVGNKAFPLFAIAHICNVPSFICIDANAFRLLLEKDENKELKDTQQFICYLKMLEDIATKEIPQSDVVDLMQISKNIMLYAKHFYFLWTGKVEYSSRIINEIKSIPELDIEEILNAAYKITQMTWLKCRIFLTRNPKIVSEYRKNYDIFFRKCIEVSRKKHLIYTVKGMRHKSIQLNNKCYSAEKVKHLYHMKKLEMEGFANENKQSR